MDRRKIAISRLVIIEADKIALRWILHQCGRNREVAAEIVRAYVGFEDKKGFLKSQGWAPKYLAEERNFTHARTAVGMKFGKEMAG